MIILRIIELSLQIVLLAMESQPVEVRKKLWEQHLARVEKWEQFWDALTPEERHAAELETR